jgi:hypothetical protein
MFISPAAGTLLNGPTTFTWTSGTGIQLYQLALGIGGPGASDLYSSGALENTVTSLTVTIPRNGAIVYATLYAQIDGSWSTVSKTFMENGAPTPPVLTIPGAGAQLAGLTTFGWQPGKGVSDYALMLGTTGPQSDDLYYSGSLANSVSSVTNVDTCTKKQTIYASLGYMVNGTWNWIPYTFKVGSTTLSVTAANLAGTVNIGVSPADNNGLEAGTAPFTRTFQTEIAVTLTAPATADGYVFSSWSGCNSTSGTTCTMKMNGNAIVTASYVKPTYSLTLNSTDPSAGVNIGVSPADNNGAAGGATGLTRLFFSGTTVTLTAPTTWAGNTFLSWTGCPSASGPVCKVVMSASIALTANFSGAIDTLTVTSVNAPGGVSVTASSADMNGLTEGTTPFSLNYKQGSTVELAAPATPGASTFVSWTGCTSSSGTACTVTMSGNTKITAKYALPQYTLTVSSSHPSTGAVIGISQADINGAAGGTAPFTRSYIGGATTSLTLTAPAQVDRYPFLAWSGCTSAAGTVCNVTMNSNMAVQANYTVLLTRGPSQQVTNGGLVTGASTQAIWRLTTNGTTGTISSLSPSFPNDNLPFTISGTGTACDGRTFTVTSKSATGNVATFNTPLHCMYDLWATDMNSTLSYNSWSTYITGMSSTPNGSGGYTVTVNVRDYYPLTAGLGVTGGTGVPSGRLISLAGTGTACDGLQLTINAQGTANQYDNGSPGFEDEPPYKIQFSSASACSFHNSANVGRLAYTGRDGAGNLYMFGSNGGYNTTTNPFFGFYGEPMTTQIRKSTDSGNTWSAPTTVFEDKSGQCNHQTDNCDFVASGFLQAPNGDFILWHHLNDWALAHPVTDISYSICNPNAVDCTQSGSWTTETFPVNSPNLAGWDEGALFGFVMPNGTDLALPLLVGAGPGSEYLIISHDNGYTWPEMIPVGDGGEYVELPTGDSGFSSFGESSILGFVGNGLMSPGCVNNPPQQQCASPNGTGGLLMLYSSDSGATWKIQPVTIPWTRPLCEGDSSSTIVYYSYNSPQIVPAAEPGMVTLTFNEHQYCTDAITNSFLRAVTFDPAIVAAHPESIGSAQALDWIADEYIGNGGMLQLSSSTFILSYEKGSGVPYGFISQDVLKATQP